MSMNLSYPYRSLIDINEYPVAGLGKEGFLLLIPREPEIVFENFGAVPLTKLA